MENNWLVVIVDFVVISCLLAIKHDINWKDKESAFIIWYEKLRGVSIQDCIVFLLAIILLKSLWKEFGHERRVTYTFSNGSNKVKKIQLGDNVQNSFHISMYEGLLRTQSWLRNHNSFYNTLFILSNTNICTYIFKSQLVQFKTELTHPF